MPDRMQEAMLVVEDMPILKRINVMVGITRSKVFFSSYRFSKRWLHTLMKEFT